MHSFLICCDLNQEFDQEELINRIAGIGDSKQILSGVWVVVSDKTAVQIRDELAELLDTSERILIAQSGSVGAWKNILGENKWLAENL